MSNESLLVIIIVGIVAGWLAGQIMQGTGYGLLHDLIIGVIGAFIGDWIAPRLGLGLASAPALSRSVTPKSPSVLPVGARAEIGSAGSASQRPNSAIRCSALPVSCNTSRPHSTAGGITST